MLWHKILLWHISKIWWHNQLVILFNNGFHLALLGTAHQHACRHQYPQQKKLFHPVPPYLDILGVATHPKQLQRHFHTIFHHFNKIRHWHRFLLFKPQTTQRHHILCHFFFTNDCDNRGLGQRQFTDFIVYLFIP